MYCRTAFTKAALSTRTHIDDDDGGTAVAGAIGMSEFEAASHVWPREPLPSDGVLYYGLSRAP